MFTRFSSYFIFTISTVHMLHRLFFVLKIWTFSRPFEAPQKIRQLHLPVTSEFIWFRGSHFKTSRVMCLFLVTKSSDWHEFLLLFKSHVLYEKIKSLQQKSTTVANTLMWNTQNLLPRLFLMVRFRFLLQTEADFTSKSSSCKRLQPSFNMVYYAIYK